MLTQRRNLKRKVLDLENAIRHALKALGSASKGLAGPASTRPRATRRR
ncbi:hypothetical protein [Mesorhizobium opportunistum]